jgi:hypothetical protein
VITSACSVEKLNTHVFALLISARLKWARIITGWRLDPGETSTRSF